MRKMCALILAVVMVIFCVPCNAEEGEIRSIDGSNAEAIASAMEEIGLKIHAKFDRKNPVEWISYWEDVGDAYCGYTMHSDSNGQIIDVTFSMRGAYSELFRKAIEAFEYRLGNKEEALSKLESFEAENQKNIESTFVIGDAKFTIKKETSEYFAGKVINGRRNGVTSEIEEYQMIIEYTDAAE